MITTLALLTYIKTQPTITFNGGLLLSEGNVERGLANVPELVKEKKLVVGISEKDKKAIFRFEGKSDDLFADFEQPIGVTYQYEKRKDAPFTDGKFQAFLNYRLTLRTSTAGFLRAVDGKVAFREHEKNVTKSIGYFSLPITFKPRYDGYGGLAWLPLPTLRVSGVGKANIEIFDLEITKQKPGDAVLVK